MVKEVSKPKGRSDVNKDKVAVRMICAIDRSMRSQCNK